MKKKLKNHNINYGLATSLTFISRLLATFLLICLTLALPAQNNNEAAKNPVTIKGIVKDSQGGFPIPGVSIVIKGTTIGTVTNAEGNFEISADINSTLVFSYVGMKPQEVIVNSASTLEILLEEDILNLEEIVVVGYGSVKRKEITSSVASVSEEGFNKGHSGNVMQLIEGKVAGLQITRPGGSDPNRSPQLLLRGISTVTGGTAPLIIIDGIPGANLNSVEPSDIESINVLRDGSAAAIYGTRGTNGVIIINTKKGKAGQLSLEYNVYGVSEQIYNKPKTLSASDYISRYEEYVGTSGSAIYDYGGDAQWLDKLVNDNIYSQYHNVAAVGGNDQTNYRVSFTYKEMDGAVIKSYRKGYNVRSNVNHNMFDNKLNLSLNLTNSKYEYRQADYGALSQAVWLNPTYDVYNPDGSFKHIGVFGQNNPVDGILSELENTWRNRVNNINLTASYEILDGLKITNVMSLNETIMDQAYYESRNSESSVEGGYNGFAQKQAYLWNSKTDDLTFDYEKAIGDHNIGIMAGYSYQEKVYEGFSMSNQDFVVDATLSDNIGSGGYLNSDTNNPGMSSIKTKSTLVAFLGRAVYSYKGKYLLTAAVRREGSSKFGKNNKWGWFPSVSAGWNLSNEEFIKNLSFINHLKLRIGYGLTGNQDIPEYISLAKYNSNGGYLYDGKWITTYGIANNPNPNIKWEKKEEMNYGLDFTLFNNRIGGHIDIYSRTTKDLLFQYDVTVPPYVKTTQWSNVGEVSNKGVEIALDGTLIKTKDIKWDLHANYAHNKNELVSLHNDEFSFTNYGYYDLPAPGNPGSNIFMLQEGRALGSFHTFEYMGLDENGQWILKDQDGDGDITEDDKIFAGQGTPTYYINFGTSVTYKNFDLSVSFRGQGGNKILNMKKLYNGNPYIMTTSVDNLLEEAFEGENANIKANQLMSTYYLEDGDFIKLDNITLGYNIPVKANIIKSARIYFSGQNLITFTKYTGQDPEVGYESGANTLVEDALVPGLDQRSFYPKTRVYTIGINIKF